MIIRKEEFTLRSRTFVGTYLFWILPKALGKQARRWIWFSGSFLLPEKTKWR